MNERRNDLEIVKGRATVDARSNSDRSPLYDVRNHAIDCPGESKELRNDVFADDVVTGRQAARLRSFGAMPGTLRLSGYAWLRHA